MSCKPDNKNTFETEQIYTKQCEVCGLFAKIYKYRSCEERQQGLQDQGVDIFKDVKEIERLANYQQGIGVRSEAKSTSKEKKSPTKQSRRGR